MPITILHKRTQQVLYETPCDTLRGADLRGADLSGADLSGADLSGADLSWADMRRADLSGADLRGADLSGADLSGADLSRARGIISFGPVGDSLRIGYAVRHESTTMVKLGCFWGSETQARAAIAEKYGEVSSYATLVSAACRTLR